MINIGRVLVVFAEFLVPFKQCACITEGTENHLSGSCKPSILFSQFSEQEWFPSCFHETGQWFQSFCGILCKMYYYRH